MLKLTLVPGQELKSKLFFCRCKTDKNGTVLTFNGWGVLNGPAFLVVEVAKIVVGNRVVLNLSGPLVDAKQAKIRSKTRSGKMIPA